MPTGAAQGVAIDSTAAKYYVSVSREMLLVIVDAKTLEKVGQVSLDGPADALTFDSKNHRAYVGHDDGTELWIIDPQAAKVVSIITIPEGPEYVIYDEASDRIFQKLVEHSIVVMTIRTHQYSTAF